MDATGAAWEHLDPAGYDSALEGFRRAATSVLDVSRRTTSEGRRDPA